MAETCAVPGAGRGSVSRAHSGEPALVVIRCHLGAAVVAVTAAAGRMVMDQLGSRCR
jgi:hypothetical protein